jgi:PPOX class probable F420-dependent enzyme
VSWPQSRADLLERPLSAVLTTHLGSGRLQSSVVWFWQEEGSLLLSTMTEFVKARNMTARPRATLTVVAPGGDRRWVEVRADVSPTGRDHLAALEAVSLRYTGLVPYFGAVVPAVLAETEHPITFRLVPHTVVTGTTSLEGPPTGVRERPLPHPAAAPSVPLPPSHHDLFDRALPAVLSTLLPDGYAMSSPVRCVRDGDELVIGSTAGRPEARNLRADPRATVLVIDPANSGRWIEVRGDVTLTGGQGPAERVDPETPVVATIRPVRVVCDAIHP